MLIYVIWNVYSVKEHVPLFLLCSPILANCLQETLFRENLSLLIADWVLSS